MADRRFMVNDAIDMLREDAEQRKAGLAAEAQRLEEHLLEAFVGRDDPNIANTGGADYLHVFEFDSAYRGEIPTGWYLDVMAGGQLLGRSLVAPSIKPGRYRAVLTLTKLPDEEPRG